MAATAEQIAEVRRKTNEPTEATYNNELVAKFIEAHPLMDTLGYEPLYYDFTTTPPTPKVNPDWTPTYDLNAAAADIWDEKAAALTENVDFQADGASISNSQVYLNARRQARHWRSRSSVRSLKLHPSTGNPLIEVTKP